MVTVRVRLYPHFPPLLQVALVFAYDAGMKEQLYATVQATCDEIQDAAGKPRCVVVVQAIRC
jgi:hypothetical protein